VNIRDNRVYLRKRCATHGSFEALVYSDAAMYRDIQRFNKPGTLPLATQTEVHDGCPLDCGLCPDHKQHACLGLIEVNTACGPYRKSLLPADRGAGGLDRGCRCAGRATWPAWPA